MADQQAVLKTNKGDITVNLFGNHAPLTVQSFVGLAFRSGEQSDYGGLIDRYVIKAVLPAGLLVLFAAGLGRVLANVGFLIRSKGDPSAMRDGVNQGTGNSGGAIHG